MTYLGSWISLLFGDLALPLYPLGLRVHVLLLKIALEGLAQEAAGGVDMERQRRFRTPDESRVCLVGRFYPENLLPTENFGPSGVC
jgi:hypothetical protein